MNRATRSMRSRTELMFQLVTVSFTGIGNQGSGLNKHWSEGCHRINHPIP
jgi:hypothetical protein